MAFGFLAGIFGAGEPPALLDFKQLRRKNSPNNFLVCPDGYASSDPDLRAPSFKAPPDVLLGAARRAIGRQERTVLDLEDAARRQLVYTQRSATVGFPDRINLEVVPLPDGTASLAIYSRSLFGHSDFGVNKRRVMSWLDAILAELGSSPIQPSQGTSHARPEAINAPIPEVEPTPAPSRPTGPGSAVSNRNGAALPFLSSRQRPGSRFAPWAPNQKPGSRPSPG